MRRKAGNPGAIYQLNEPKLLPVRADDQGMPIRVFDGKQWLNVVRLQDRWVVGPEGWWRPPDQQHHRMYHVVEIEGGSVWTIFEDRIRSQWYRQPYGVGHQATAAYLQPLEEASARELPED